MGPLDPLVWLFVKEQLYFKEIINYTNYDTMLIKCKPHMLHGFIN